MRGLVVPLDAGSELPIERQASERERLGVVLGLLKLAPRHARPCERASQVIEPVRPTHEPSQGQPFLVVERMVAAIRVRSEERRVGKEWQSEWLRSRARVRDS